MNDWSEYPELLDCMTTLKVTSRDDTNGVFMTESDLKVVNFDKVMKNYCNNFKISLQRSNDALIKKENGWAFVEFKNGRINNSQSRLDLQKKIYDSLLVFNDLVGCNISYTRDNVDYYLVYNEEKNTEKTIRTNTTINSSGAFEEIEQIISKCANDRIVRFGLQFFEKYCIRTVNTYTQEEFEIMLKDSNFLCS